MTHPFSGRWNGDTVTVTIRTPGGPATIDGTRDTFSVHIGSADLGRFAKLDDAIDTLDAAIRIGPGSVLWLVVSRSRARVYGRGPTIEAANRDALTVRESLHGTDLIQAYANDSGFVELFDAPVVIPSA